MTGARHFTVMMLVAATLAVVPPSSAGATPRPTPEQGEGLMTAGFIAQGLGIGLGIAGIIEDGTGGSGVTTIIGVPYHIASIPFAPITVAGFGAVHDGPGRRGWQFGVAHGSLEGAAYSGVIVGLRALKMLSHDQWCQRPEANCWDDVGALIDWFVLVPHGVVAITLLTAGLATIAGVDHSRFASMQVPGVELGLVPVPGGLAVAGRF